MKSFKQIRDERVRDFGCCELCGRKFSLDLHHIIPKSMGGSDSEDNLILLCGVCHSRLTPKRILAKNGLLKKFIKYYISTYLNDKYYMIAYELLEENGWTNPFGTNLYADAFDVLIESENERFDKLNGNDFFHWKNLDHKPKQHRKDVLSEIIKFHDINGKEIENG